VVGSASQRTQQMPIGLGQVKSVDATPASGLASQQVT
jgi:hypothetical protein